MMFPELGNWYSIKDGDPVGRAILNRHYSARHYKDGRKPKLFVGPGEKMVLMTPDSLALFVWRKFRDDSGQVGVNCAAFRNDGPLLSSALIREAVDLARRRWPTERLYSYVNAKKVQSRNPGYCFQMAGWRKCGTTKGGLLIYELN
jgi:hypothetical protein